MAGYPLAICKVPARVHASRRARLRMHMLLKTNPTDTRLAGPQGPQFKVALTTRRHGLIELIMNDRIRGSISPFILISIQESHHTIHIPCLHPRLPSHHSFLSSSKASIAPFIVVSIQGHHSPRLTHTSVSTIAYLTAPPNVRMNRVIHSII